MTVQRNTTGYIRAQGAYADSKRWFPKTAESIPHYTLALCGEVGELANIIKKIDRGSNTWKEPKVRLDVAMEIADAYTYLLCLAGVLGLDLDHLYEQKRRQNEGRFGKPLEARDGS